MSIAILLLSTLSWGWPLAKPTPPTEAILAEGLRLYQSERSSWVATDLMLATTIDRAQIGGYLSYLAGDSVRTIFWPKGTAGTVGTPLLASYSFLRQDVRVGTGNYRPAGAFTAHEAQLFAIRQAVREEMSAGKNPYPVPANTSLNIALVEAANEVRAYLIVGPKESGVVPIGNDFLLTFSPGGKFKSIERLHNSYLPLRRDAVEQEVKAMIHSHLAAHPYITPTDICSTLLYRTKMPGQQHIVVSEEYVSLFDIDTQQLAILTRKAFEKMSNFKK
ncbi:MAG: hypothetical protein EOO62_30220 [Hymenobacter sp.]|nr:MAG: hypothetical protein EOO62_30220 [Hymenobacter sp.]